MNCSTGSSQKRWFAYGCISVSNDSVNNLLRKYCETKICSFSKWHHTNIHYPYVTQVYQLVFRGLQLNLVWPVDNKFYSFSGLDNSTMGKISFNGKRMFSLVHVKSIVYIWKALNQKYSESIWLSKSKTEMWTSSNFFLNTENIFPLLFFFPFWWFLMLPWISDEVCLSGGQV